MGNKLNHHAEMVSHLQDSEITNNYLWMGMRSGNKLRHLGCPGAAANAAKVSPETNQKST